MAAQKNFIHKNLQYVQVMEYLNDELKLAGQGKIEIHKTPMGHRVVIHAVRLGIVIGRRGRNVRKITDILEHVYGLETPQLEVRDLENPHLNSRVMAGRLISQIQKGFHFRRAGYALVRRIMGANARGCEITIKGKLTSQRARAEVFRDGFVAKCGEPAEKFVDSSVMEVTLKQGVIGVHVKIMQPDATLPDDAEIVYDVFAPPKAEEKPEEVEAEEIEPEEEEQEIETESEILEELGAPPAEEASGKVEESKPSSEEEAIGPDTSEPEKNKDLLQASDFDKED
ncbi:MAG: 30S ribosomal protein S3 [Candidatus Thorarchaeota archaeon]